MSGPLFRTSSGSALTKLKAALMRPAEHAFMASGDPAHAVTEGESMPNDQRVKLVRLRIRDNASVKARTIRTGRLPGRAGGPRLAVA
jgi:hypothetical protein